MLFLLFFISLVSFGQVDSFKDIQGISSLDQFKRVMIENNYQFTEEEDGWIWYGINPSKDEDDRWVSRYWGGYNTSTNQWTLQYSEGLFNFGGYEDIFDEVKERCKFFKIVKFIGADPQLSGEYACYSCPESSYKGKIGFRLYENTGIIRHFPEE